MNNDNEKEINEAIECMFADVRQRWAKMNHKQRLEFLAEQTDYKYYLKSSLRMQEAALHCINTMLFDEYVEEANETTET